METLSPPNLNDYLTTELFGSPVSSSSVSSPASSSSLQTPPESAPLASFDNDLYGGNFGNGPNDYGVQSDLFNFLKAPATTSFDDFMSSLQSGAVETLGIDPSLMSSPKDSSPSSSTASTSSPPAPSPIEPAKVGGHGNKARKGTVQSGGVTKKASSSRPAPPKQKASPPVQEQENDDEEHDGDDEDIPASWRPAPEVYAKMSSKEKRQLRNKISARNFRMRRKEYISTLELDIAERDRLLSAIRSELGSSQSENQALRREIDALKTVLMGGHQPSPVKEEPMHTSMDTWGGLGFGTSTAVHTMLMPEWNSDKANSRELQENINPALNSSPSAAESKVHVGGFDGFADGNAFTLKNLDSYRMHLWTKMASQNLHHPNSPPSPPSSFSSAHSSPSPPHHPMPDPRFSPSPFTNPSLPLPSSLSNFALPGPYLTGSPTLHGLASHMGVKYFRSADKPLAPAPSLGDMLSGKHSPLSPSAKHNASKQPQPQHQQMPTAEQAIIASLAHQTLFKRLGGAFWDAFSGTPSSSSSSASSSAAPMFDSDKVRKVLEGTAVVRVVDVEPSKPVVVKKEVDGVCALLEESMRSLTINKK